MLCLCFLVCTEHQNIIICFDLRIPSIWKYLKEIAIKQNIRSEVTENPLIEKSKDYQILNCKMCRPKLALIR